MTSPDHHFKVFLLGVGAQKAGTSWLHEQLHNRHDADFGFCKEYHILDALTLPQFAHFQPKHSLPWKWRTWRRKRFLQDSSRYFDYFSNLLQRPSNRLTGDITPSYGCLSADTLQWTREQFSERGVTTRVVFLMRDPVERILSQQRMKLRKRGELHPDAEREQLRRAARTLQQRASQRSDYLHTLQALSQAFSSDDLCIDLYERLFTENIYQRLCQHLMIDYQEPNWSRRVNESRTTTNLPEDVLASIGQSQALIYNNVAQQFPHLDLARHWPLASRWCRSINNN
ncbi:MAG: sulfotransferase family protein [Cyanobacteriota bacterium]|nr:sulfotransferase family protein [Cyanobacteriota bacterium]